MMERGETNTDGTTYLGELTAAQVIKASEWIMEGDGYDSVRFYLLEDDSVDVHQGDAFTNIDPDGTVNG
jgi:hypothetical protein